MSPNQIIESDVDLIQQFTRCRTVEATTALEVAVISWPKPDRSVIRWEPACAWPSRPTPDELAQAWREVLNNARFFRACAVCHRRHLRGHLHDDTICPACADQPDVAVG